MRILGYILCALAGILGGNYIKKPHELLPIVLAQIGMALILIQF